MARVIGALGIHEQGEFEREGEAADGFFNGRQRTGLYLSE
jgi:hypothetical protein